MISFAVTRARFQLNYCITNILRSCHLIICGDRGLISKELISIIFDQYYFQTECEVNLFLLRLLFEIGL